MDSNRQGALTSKIKRPHLQPDFCPLHEVYGPCIRCLAPEVINIITSDETRLDNRFFFQSMDRNPN